MSEIAKNKIMNLLEEKEISLLRLSKETGLSYPTIHNAMKKEYLDNIKLSTIIKIASVLDCNIEELYEREPYEERLQG